MSKPGKVGLGAFCVILAVAVIIAILSIKVIPAGYAGVVYTMNNGVSDEVLTDRWNFVGPTKKVSKFTIGNEQILLTKDSREGSKDDESFRVATSDDASVAISFQMTYRFDVGRLPETYKKFKGMDGNKIVETRVKSVLKSKVSEITTDYSLMDIYSGNRAEINAKITDYLGQNFLDAYGLEVIDASIIDCHPDKKLRDAINKRVNTTQEKADAILQQEKAKIEYETKLMKAKKEAEIKITEAEAEAKANKLRSESITDKLLKEMEMEARMKHGWVTISGNNTVVKE